MTRVLSLWFLVIISKLLLMGRLQHIGRSRCSPGERRSSRFVQVREGVEQCAIVVQGNRQVAVGRGRIDVVMFIFRHTEREKVAFCSA